MKVFFFQTANEIIKCLRDNYVCACVYMRVRALERERERENAIICACSRVPRAVAPNLYIYCLHTPLSTWVIVSARIAGFRGVERHFFLRFAHFVQKPVE